MNIKVAAGIKEDVDLMDLVLKEQMKWEERPEDERLRPDLAAVENQFSKDYLRKIAKNPQWTAQVQKWIQ